MSGTTTLFSSKTGDINFPMTPTSIDGMTIGSTTPEPGAFTNLAASGAVSGAGFAAAFLAWFQTNTGTFTANGASAVTVAAASVTAGSQILITLKTVGGTVGAIPHIETITPGTGFTIVGTALDTSVYNYTVIG
jgi:hypothetical protein